MVSLIKYLYQAKQDGKLFFGAIWAMDSEQAIEILTERNYTDIVL